MKIRKISNDEVTIRCAEIANSLPKHQLFYGVPRGGIAPAYSIAAMSEGGVVDSPNLADYIVDDLIDSGATRSEYISRYPHKKFIALFEKEDNTEWFVFPWEVTKDNKDESGEDIFLRLLQFVGEDTNREGLVETPARMARMYREITSGYAEDPSSYFKTFSENAEGYDEMIILSPIPFFSMCEHHMAPFFGTATIGYIPDKRFAGLSKFARVVETFSKRLQIQERLTHQIAECIDDYVAPSGVAVVVKARHLCMEMRGVRTHDVYTTTSALKGVFLDQQETRNEFLHLIKD
jgi:GTP cyclohydrolase I